MPTLTNEMMRSIIMDHYANHYYKHNPEDDGYVQIHHKSENCIDDIDVFVKFDGDKIVDCCWNGVACTIATSSTDIMCSLVIGKSKKEAIYIIEQYFHMIKEEPYDEEVLEEANAFVNTSKQAARIRCATIGWNSLEELIGR